MIIGHGVFPENGGLSCSMNEIELIVEEEVQEIIVGLVVLCHVLGDRGILVPASVDRFVASAVIVAVWEELGEFRDHFAHNLIGFGFGGVQLACGGFGSQAMLPCIIRLQIIHAGTCAMLKETCQYGVKRKGDGLT